MDGVFGVFYLPKNVILIFSWITVYNVRNRYVVAKWYPFSNIGLLKIFETTVNI